VLTVYVLTALASLGFTNFAEIRLDRATEAFAAVRDSRVCPAIAGAVR
jgi:hypothetical protein